MTRRRQERKRVLPRAERATHKLPAAWLRFPPIYDWQDAARYEPPPDVELVAWWRWQAVRRSPAYRALAQTGFPNVDRDPAAYAELCYQWGIVPLRDPEDEHAPHIAATDPEETEHPSHVRLHTPVARVVERSAVVLGFGADESPELAGEAVKQILRSLHGSSHRGRPPGINVARLPAMFRALDGRLAGASLADIAGALSAVRYHQTARKHIADAIKFCDGGYKNLFPEVPSIPRPVYSL